jgi:hypothetical protein
MTDAPQSRPSAGGGTWASRHPRLARHPRLLWTAATLLAGIALMCAYLPVAGTVPVLSDGAGNALQAWAMLHGNLLLHGWWVTDVSFYTTELPQYMLAELVWGLHPEVVHICAALTYTLLVLLAAFVAAGRSRGREGIARAALAAGIFLAPQLGVPSWVLLSSPDHTGTAVPVLVILLLLDRARRRWYLPVAVGALLAWTIVGDPLVLVIGVLPLLVVCLSRVAEAVARREPLRSRWLELSLAAACLAAVAVSDLANRLIRALGGFSASPVVTKINGLAGLRANARLTADSVLAVFGADFSGPMPAWQVAFAVAHLAGLALVLCGLVLAIRHFFAREDLVSAVLAVAVVANIAAYPFVYRISNIYSAHEVAPVMALGAALAGRQLGGAAARRRAVPVLAAGFACACVMLATVAAAPQAAPSSAGLTRWLARHHLTAGIGGYWQANSVTLDSGGAITVGSVVGAGPGRIVAREWEADMSFFDPARHDADFLVTVPGGPVTAREGTDAFGRPERTYHYGQYTIMVWRSNLLSSVGTG